MEEIEEEEEGPQREEIVPGVARALSPLVRRITATNPGPRTGIGTNTYLVGIDEIVVIDPGPIDETHISTIAGCGGDRIGWIITTSDDPAHAEAVAELADRTGAEVVESPPDGYMIVGTEFRLIVRHLPGTHPEHRTLVLPEERLLFAGDLIAEGSTVAIEPPHGDMAAYLDSLAAARKYRLKRIAPGHGHLIDDAIPVIDEYIAHRLEREEQVLAALKDGLENPVAIAGSIYTGLEADILPLAEATVHAHLIKLASDGRAKEAYGTWSPK